jgi:ATP-dependent DNA helicase RecG
MLFTDAVAGPPNGMPENTPNESTERLEKFTKMHDGFALAELDLQMRGGGDMFGDQQSGFYSFKFFSFAEHRDLNRAAKEWAIRLLSVDGKLAGYPELRAKVKEKFVHME